ncbi:MAG: hypothetical protein ACREAM_22005, partial [Blastocatellia bacterium]
RPSDLAIWGGLAGLGLDALAQDVEDFHHLWVMIGLASARSGVADFFPFAIRCSFQRPDSA